MRKILYLFAFLLMCSMTSNAQLKVVADGSVGIGTSTPGKKLEVVGQFMLNNVTNYPANKQATMTMRHHSDAATDFAYFRANASASQNSVSFGGGAGVNYASTTMIFWTAGNTTTTNGTERMRIRGDGRVGIGVGSITHDLSVNGTAAKTGGGAWATVSDRRLKKGVREYDGGLKEIMKINPVYFQYKDGIDAHENSEYVGIIAQEMEKIAPYTITEVEAAFDEGVTRTHDLETYLTYDGTAVTYMLVNAVQEQQAQIKEKDAQIEDIMTKLEALTAQVATLTGNTTSTNVELNSNTPLNAVAANLAQNSPNPFNEETSISYNVPQTAANAEINIVDMRGNVLKTIGVDKGQGQLNLKANTLSSGTYMYQLVVDGKVIDTKSMILTK